MRSASSAATRRPDSARSRVVGMAERELHQLHADDAGEADIDLRLADAGCGLADAEVAQQGDLQAGAGGDAVDGGDTGLVEVADCVVMAAQVAHPSGAAIGVEAAGFGEIVAGAECGAGAGDDDGADSGVVVDRREGGADFGAHGGVNGVARGGPVQRDDTNAVIVHDFDEFHGPRFVGQPGGWGPPQDRIASAATTSEVPNPNARLA